MSLPQNFVFSSCDGTKRFILSMTLLQQYPNNLFLKLIKYDLARDKFPDGSFKTPLDVAALKKVIIFFLRGSWDDRHLICNKLEIKDGNYKFEEACDYLGLPYNFQQDEDPYEFEDDWTFEEIEDQKNIDKQADAVSKKNPTFYCNERGYDDYESGYDDYEREYDDDWYNPQ